MVCSGTENLMLALHDLGRLRYECSTGTSILDYRDVAEMAFDEVIETSSPQFFSWILSLGQPDVGCLVFATNDISARAISRVILGSFGSNATIGNKTSIRKLHAYSMPSPFLRSDRFCSRKGSRECYLHPPPCEST